MNQSNPIGPVADLSDNAIIRTKYGTMTYGEFKNYKPSWRERFIRWWYKLP